MAVRRVPGTKSAKKRPDPQKESGLLNNGCYFTGKVKHLEVVANGGVHSSQIKHGRTSCLHWRSDANTETEWVQINTLTFSKL